MFAEVRSGSARTKSPLKAQRELKEATRRPNRKFCLRGLNQSCPFSGQVSGRSSLVVVEFIFGQGFQRYYLAEFKADSILAVLRTIPGWSFQNAEFSVGSKLLISDAKICRFCFP